jgi:NAD(P)-dependent dehydrogenase (short-subunit alcohol dehydrogenase family)
MDSPFSLNGKTVLVTGATGGIGFATCVRIAGMGGTVIALGRRQEALDRLRDELGEGAHRVVSLDITDNAARKQIIAELPKLDGVVHAAGINRLQPLRFIKPEDFQSITEINYMLPVLFAQDLLQKKLLNQEASVVFISSISHFAVASGMLAYAGSKGALISATRVMALELARQKIRVNCVSPGMVVTPMLSAYTEEECVAEQTKYPLGLGKPEDVADACVYLLSPASRWMTGANLILDGGFTLR